MNFEEWIKKNPKSIEPSILNHHRNIQYLRNRLFMAFEAGISANEMGERERRLQLTIEWYESSLRDLRKKNKELRARIARLEKAQAQPLPEPEPLQP